MRSHLITTFSASHVNNDITIGKLGYGLGDDSLPTTKSSRDGGSPALHAPARQLNIHTKRHEVRVTYGNRASRILCPVRKGWSAVNFSETGRGARTGHSCIIECFVILPSNSVSSTVSSTA